MCRCSPDWLLHVLLHSLHVYVTDTAASGGSCDAPGLPSCAISLGAL